DDELYFEIIDEIIVASILTGGFEKLETFSVKIMLQFIGTKFLEKHQDKIEDLLFDWNTGVKGFTDEITTFLKDDELLEDIKREQFQNLFMGAISGDFPLESLYWKGIQLFANQPQEALKDSIKKILDLKDVIATIINDDLQEGKIHDMLHRLQRDLQAKILDSGQRKLIILSKKNHNWEILNKILPAREIYPLYCPNIETLEQMIETWIEPTSYDILVIDSTITTKEIRKLYSMNMREGAKVIIVVKKIPRAPRGRLVQKRSISFIVDNMEEFDRNSPFVEYLSTFLINGQQL
ncbi:MAG: hypothetical protein ACXADW_15745, partial [Candidatus Hodarchaeales archaeon]